MAGNGASCFTSNRASKVKCSQARVCTEQAGMTSGKMIMQSACVAKLQPKNGRFVHFIV